MMGSFYKFQFVLAVSLVGLFFAPMKNVAAQTHIEAGILDCVVDGGVGFILGSAKDLRCEFRSANDERPTEVYFGVIRKFGLDIGSTDDAFIQWVVFAPTNGYQPGALSGNYLGVSGEATLGAGIGANALIGGLERSFALQPLSLQQQRGFNLAAGISRLELRSIGD